VHRIVISIFREVTAGTNMVEVRAQGAKSAFVRKAREVGENRGN
jgi:hypothetical protein